MLRTTRNKVDALEKRLLSLLPPTECPVTFIFEDGERVTFPNGHAALIFAIKNRNNNLNVTIETVNTDGASMAKAVLATRTENNNEQEK